MSFSTIIITAFALAMDAFAVSLATGLSDKKNAKVNAWRCGIAFGVFQSGMTMIGWLLGFALYRFIQPFDHWVAFALLVFIGVRMIIESFNIEDVKPLIRFRMLFALALVTSIDAMAAGLSFSTLNAPILFPAAIIGGVTFIMSFIGVHLGVRLSRAEKLESYADFFGGVVLILIGIRILVEHLIKHI
ncbi:MAG: manganese efflux pump MntP family protein [Eubacteriales bacterium]